VGWRTTASSCCERNRLDRVIVGGLTTTYGVNGLGERVAKDGQQAFGKVEHVYDLAGQVLGLYKSGAALEEIVWLGALPVGTIQGGAAYSIAPDHLGAPYKIVNSANAQVWFWDHDPFGNGAPTAAAGFSHRLRFPGQIYDAESGLHSNGQRDYDPRLGRYVESDPLGLEGGINTYAYANNNPVNAVDPSGTIVETGWDIANIAMGVYSFFDNLFQGNYAAAGIDAVGLGVDVAAAAIPGVPGGAAAAIGAARSEAAAITLSRKLHGAQHAASAATAEPLAKQLARESAESAFTADGRLSSDVLANANKIIDASEIGNPNVPSGISKFETQTFQSPSGDFRVHFYMNQQTGIPYYGLDYKTVFNRGLGR
jgi:RHS repeat-associated protein